MTRSTPRLALALLERFVPDSEPLAGDLIEEFERRQSVLWFWWQVLGAVAAAWFAGVRRSAHCGSLTFSLSRRWNERGGGAFGFVR